VGLVFASTCAAAWVGCGADVLVVAMEAVVDCRCRRGWGEDGEWRDKLASGFRCVFLRGGGSIAARGSEMSVEEGVSLGLACG